MFDSIELVWILDEAQGDAHCPLHQSLQLPFDPIAIPHPPAAFKSNLENTIVRKFWMI